MISPSLTIVLIVLMTFLPFSQCYDFTNIPKATSTKQGENLAPNNATSDSLHQDSIFYNISSLGLPDPFSQYSTLMSYDSKVDITDPHSNQRGSILSILNGTVFPMGSVGSISAMGWDGGSNQTDIEKHNTNAHSNSSTESQPAAKGALSGIWLAFTSKDAITGGYTFNNDSLTTSNNIFYQNLTFLSNFTIRQDGTYTFTFSLSTLTDEGGANNQIIKLTPPQCTKEVNDTRFAMKCVGFR